MSPTIALWARSSTWERNVRRRGDYCYHLLLAERKTINCSENPYQKILDLDLAEHFHVAPVEEDKGGEYKRDDIVFHLDLQQIAMETRIDPGAEATRQREGKGKGRGKVFRLGWGPAP